MFHTYNSNSNPQEDDTLSQNPRLHTGHNDDNNNHILRTVGSANTHNSAQHSFHSFHECTSDETDSDDSTTIEMQSLLHAPEHIQTEREEVDLRCASVRKEVKFDAETFTSGAARSTSNQSLNKEIVEEFMTRTLKHMDSIEDEFDELTHKRLLPIDLQIALEEGVFGWSHLMTDVLGHIFYPVGSAWITYKVITFVYFSFGLPLGLPADNDKDDNVTQVESNEALVWFLGALRNVWTFASLVGTYRTVRRRRKIWLSHSDKDELRVVDEETKMGRKWRDYQNRRRLQKKVQRASKQFDNKLANPRTSVTRNSNLPLHVISRIPRIKSMLYTHGGYFAAAPYMLHDPRWIYILRQLMPEVYVEVARRVHLDSAKLIHWAENNPVVAAYGTLMSRTLNNEGSLALEWDIFLDPILVARLVRALDVRESLSQEKNDDSRLTNTVNKVIRSRTHKLVVNMLIAHGTATQLLMEQIPRPHFVKSYNFTRVQRACKTLGGGIEIWRWLAIYAQALKMGHAYQTSAVPSRSSSDDETERDEGTSCADYHNDAPRPLRDQSLYGFEFIDTPDLDFHDSNRVKSMRMSISQITSIINQKLAVLLDVKSRHVDKRVWSLVIAFLQDQGISVEGIGSFIGSDIRGVSDILKEAGSDSVREIFFFHSIGDLQYACHYNLVEEGDSVLFNSGSLFGSDFPTDQLKKYKERYNFFVGLYTQEFAVDPVSAETIASHVNNNLDLYDLGLCWGGVNGLTVRSIQPGRFTSTDGLWNQRYLGKYWRHDIEVGDDWGQVGGIGTCEVLYGTFQ